MNAKETSEAKLIDTSKAENISKTENLSINDPSSNLTAKDFDEQNLLNNKKGHINEEPTTKNNVTLSEKEGVRCKNIIPIEECKAEEVSRIYKKLPGCKFCDIIHNNSGKIIFENEHCVAFYDKKKKTAKCHILVCSKDHIKNSHEVPKDNISILLHIQKAGEDLLKKLWPDADYRFGYHEPPMNSVDHLHLHCLVPPIKVKYLDHVVYGIKLASTDKIISKILNDEIGAVKESEGEINKEKES